MAGDPEDNPQSLKARWVFPGDGPPLENATVELSAGSIVEVHTCERPGVVDLGNAAIIPGLVNAHTHLEFSDLAKPLAPNAPFADWIRNVVRWRRRQPSATGPIARGAAESLSAGTTLLADIVTDDAGPPAYPSEGPGIVAFRELIGLLPDQASERLETARRFLAAGEPPAATSVAAGGPPAALLDAVSGSGAHQPDARASEPGGPQESRSGFGPSLARRAGVAGETCTWVRGLSPHAPYSVHPELYRSLVDLAARRRVPLAVHLAETPAELELLQSGTGELADLLREFGVWSEAAIPRGSRPMHYLEPLAGLDRALVVHGNYLDADEIAFIAEHPQLTVVYCPRTHAYFGHRAHPWRELLACGASVALGTDSRASNPDLSLFDELRFLRRRDPDVDPQLLLRLGTLAGAQALGFGEATGSLTPGKSADLAIVALPDSGAADDFELLFALESLIVRVMCAGRWVDHPTEVGAVTSFPAGPCRRRPTE